MTGRLPLLQRREKYKEIAMNSIIRRNGIDLPEPVRRFFEGDVM